MNNEIFFPIKGYENFYEVSNWGRVKSMKKIIFLWNSYAYHARHYKERILKIQNNVDGYNVIRLCKNATCKQFRVGRLVATTFIENPHYKPEVNHKNGNKKDDRIDNLEWCTSSENQKHAIKIGLQKPKKGEQHPHSRLTEKQVKEIREMKATNHTTYYIAHCFCISEGHVRDIVARKAWKHIT